MKRYMQHIGIAGLISILLLGVGCSVSRMAGAVSDMIPEGVKETAGRATPDGANPSLTSQPQVVWDQWVRKGKVQVYLRPREEPAVEPTVLFFPFMPKVNMAQGRHISRELSRMVWQTWLEEELFPVMEFADYSDYYTPERAVSLARMRGADLAVGGYITHYMPGGTASDTHVALQLDIYDSASGQLIWSMAHAGVMQSERTRDYIFFSAKTRLPAEPTGAVMQVLSHDMAVPLHAWVAPLKEEAKQAEAQGGGTAF